MPNPNEYLVFEADQVLTNEHLNQLFYYVDQQNRWTRNKLIGIGIACGLNIVQKPGIIQVTKGVGVTSQGYLILHELTNYSYYIPYAGIDQPQDLPFTYPGKLPFYKPYCLGKSVQLLLSDDEYNQLEANKQPSAKTISSAGSKLLDDFVVVLFLEATELDLKNCDAFDCNNKGEKMQLQVRALLVKKTELPGVAKEKAGKVITNLIPNKAPEIDFKRFNVPYKDLKSTDDIINAFITLVDDNTLATISKAYSFCYEKYNFLYGLPSNPYTTMLADLKKVRDSISKNNPVFIQYFYDFIDDLIKAYYEFRVKAWDLVSECCPDENKFPLHLVLGDATANTTGFERDKFRQYFIYSPLFDRQGNEVSELVFLFTKMQILLKEFTVLSQKSIKEADIKITPSQYEFHWLSERAIPYYYKVNDPGNEVYKYWKYSRTMHGNAAFNLGYNSNLYNGSTGVLNPLLYDIEYYNFFRIEGHIGLNYKSCLTNILNQRQKFNLPFDVVAVSSEQLELNSDHLPECNLQDLDTAYQLILSEFSCKVHTPFCFITKFPFPLLSREKNAAGGLQSDNVTYSDFKKEAELKINFAFTFTKPVHKKGDFLRTYCKPPANAKTVGSAYLNALDANGKFDNPIELVQQPSTSNSGSQESNLLYYYIFEYIDAVEDLMKVLTPASIATLDMAAFKVSYQRFKKNAAFLTLLIGRWLQTAFPSDTSGDNNNLQWLKEIELDILIDEFSIAMYACIDERLETLKQEYQRRLQLYELQKSFFNYYKKHPGLEHKAGVPKGGTFVLVYNAPKPPAAVTFVPGALTNFGDRRAADIAVKDEFEAKEVSVTAAQATQPKANYYDETTIKLFKSFVDDCNDAPIEKKKLILDILTNFQPKAPTYQIPNDVIIADFYVPYLCCSDCPPVAYVFTEEKPEVTVFDINPKVFLFDDAHNYPFTARPPVTQANIEQNPFNPTDNLKYPPELNFWADEKNVLYLHPAMPELKQTLKATITYKEIAVSITIIKPDAAFQVQVSRDKASPNGQPLLRVTAINKDAQTYLWLVNEKDDVFEKSHSPAPINLEQLMRKTDTNQFFIELTIGYELNGHVSENTKGGRLTADEIKKKIGENDEKPFELVYEKNE